MIFTLCLSCSFVEDVAVVKANVDIKANEEIFRFCTTVFLPRGNMRFESAECEMRKELLKRLCFIDCKCEICTDPMKKKRAMDAYLCIKCKGPAAKIGQNMRVQCVKCNYKFTLLPDTPSKEKMVWYKVFKRHTGSKTDIEELYDCLKICENIYFLYHNIFLQIYKSLATFHVRQENAKEYLTCARIEMKLILERNVSNIMGYGILIYAVCLMTMTILSKGLPESNSELE
ncbi:hypothetical protein ILUMI_22182 [Ignelater luminosus]|uniref:Uncharacterized protein n=1 Tax=Ignelater luminosus TaxID=2038154 RepID=A0A8K0CD81_IGNLU|nr:hypothetical protein ILUMI_22182 [Ignelater luminosus]